MSEPAGTVKASTVSVGDRIRSRGLELTVTRIETSFLGSENMLAFIEDTEAQWLKLPTPRDADIELLR